MENLWNLLESNKQFKKYLFWWEFAGMYMSHYMNYVIAIIRRAISMSKERKSTPKSEILIKNKKIKNDNIKKFS